tara:strand:- start:993 stop:1352 length:360 start_codon:yes stop_codon:yes gene_type:complete
MKLNNVIAVIVFLAFAVVPIFADVKTHTLTIEEKLERIEQINVTAFKQIIEDLEGLDKSVVLALTEAFKSNARFRWENLTEEERKDVREKMRKTTKVRFLHFLRPENSPSRRHRKPSKE